MKDSKHGLAYTDPKPYGGLYKAMHKNNRLASLHSASRDNYRTECIMGERQDKLMALFIIKKKH